MKNKTLKKSLKKNIKKTYTKNDYKSGDGMVTATWGPAMWHYLHTISFNYPVNPTKHQKNKYKQFLLNLQHTLPCRYCRINLKNNFKKFPLKKEFFESRDKFSRYIYSLHELINKMLGKKSGLTYCEVRDRYENFRSRCTVNTPKIFNFNKTKKQKEKGCTTALYGNKAKCVLSFVPASKKCKTLKIDKKCLKKKIYIDK
tara:strand:- start:4312 stop:4911 length:600 start_codon:yes stop_codon:yes gene_type:complete